MPPKKTTKRKAESDDEAAPSSSKTTKKSKIEEDTSGLSPTGQPTNKVLPVDISFPKCAPGSLRIAAWNVCGLLACQKKGFKYYVAAEDADILILTETKVNDVPMDPFLKECYPYQYWTISEKKTYSGTAILSKYEALSVDKSLPGHTDSSIVKGRIITLEFESCYVVGTYVPNAGTQLKTLDVKKEWNKHFDTYIRDLDKRKPVIWTGDVNVAPTAIDLSNPKPNWNKTPGYTEAETTAFKNILSPTEESSAGTTFVDVWRQLHPTDKHFTYFGYRFNARAKGIGWRLDMFVLSQRITERVKMCEIRSEIYGASDHCPVVLEIEGSL